jgi:CubicO group peptidase (beta-lactamase class C family)
MKPGDWKQGKWRVCALLLLLFAVGNVTVAAECRTDRSSLDPVARQRIDDALGKVIPSDADAPGAGVVAVLNGEIIVCSAFGYANLEHDVKITHESRFEMASVSKQFTALAILLLAQDGKLELDDPVTDYLDWFPDFGYEVRIHHLIHHTSGIKDIYPQLVLTGRSYLDAYWSSNARSLLERQRSLNHIPGEQYSYTNSGYFLLAQIVEQVAQQSLPEFLEERLFVPLGMQDAKFRSSPTQLLPRRVNSYRFRRGEFSPFPSNAAVVGPAYLHLSVNDMAIWAAQFGDPDSRVAALLNRMIKIEPLPNGSRNRYTYGLFVDRYRKMSAITHSGGWLGFSSYQQYLPEQKLTIIVASNNSRIKSVDVVHTLTDAILGLDALIPPETETGNGPDQQALELFAGLYETEFGDFKEMEVRDGQLGFLALPSREFNALIPNGPAWFRVADSPLEQIEFVQGPSGLATQYLVHLDNGPTLQRMRVEKVESGPDDFEQYLGRYFSEELETLYTIRRKDEGIVASSIAFGDIKLKPASKDGFTGVFWFPTVRFLRDFNQSITGFNVTMNRVRHAYFKKIDW